MLPAQMNESIHYLLRALYHLDKHGFCFVCLAKYQGKISNLFFAQIESLFGVYGMGMLVLSDIFCTFSRNTKLPNFGNIFREKYSSYFYKQGVI